MNKRVLVVEPSRTLRLLLQIYLQRSCHYTALFSDYEKAAKALTLPIFQQQPPDVVLAAISLATLEQFKHLLILKQQPYFTNTILIAMIPNEEVHHRHIQRFLQLTQAISLLKPYRIQDVIALVSNPHKQEAMYKRA